MVTHELSKQALAQAFQEAAEHFSEYSRLKQKLNAPRYLDGELIGEGGAKLVYQTEDRVTGRKLVRAYPKSPELEDDFLREAMLHAHLEHPNIVPFYDLGLEDRRPFFCMKLIEGETLEKYVVQCDGELESPAVRNDLLDAFLKVCDAVSYAHAHDVLHLDLKPSNIQLSSYGEVLVGDWGLARISESEEWSEHEGLPSWRGCQSTGQFTRHGYLSGTPGFMAPEQCKKGEAKTSQADIYALGAVLVFILTGRAPICGDTEGMMADTLSGKWSFSLASIPLGLRAVVGKALAVDQLERYASVQELQDDVNAYRSGFLTSAEDFSSKRLLQSLYRRNKSVVHISVLSLFILLIVSAIFVRQLRQSEHLALQAQVSQQQQGEDFANDYLRESLVYYKANDRGRYVYPHRYDEKAYQMVNKALQLEPDNLEAWALKGQLAMLTNRLDEATDAFAKAGENYQAHRLVCEEFKGQNILDTQVLCSMLWALLPTHDLRLIHDFMYKTIYNRELPEQEMVDFIEESLNMRNLGDKSRLHFEYDTQKQSLDMSNNRQLRYIFMLKNLPLREVNFSNTSIGRDFYHLDRMPLVKVNVANSKMDNARLIYLRGRPVRELILTNCRVSDLSPLRDLPLVRIDLRGTKVKDFSPIADSSDLREVICTEQQKPLLLQSGVSAEKLLVQENVKK